MKVLLLNGSPHKNGCTYTALHEVEKALQLQGIDTEILHIGSKPVGGCIGCGGCRSNNGHCVFTEDSVNEAIDKMKTCDGLIVGSPVYYASGNGSLIGFLDRMFFAGSSSMAGKPAAAVCSARRGGTTATLDQLQKYFTISQMPIVASRYWNMVHGNTPEEVAQDKEGLQVMRMLGTNMAWLLNCIDAGKKAGITFPAPEEAVKTNFIR